MKESGGFVFLAYSSVPLTELSKITKICGKDAIFDPDLARMAGATMAFGLPGDVDALKKLLEPVALAKTETENPGLSENAINWLATGERGMSSETLFYYLTGHYAPDDDGDHYPHDPDDLRRCMLLLDACPELKPNLHLITQAGPVWSSLFAHWDSLTRTFEDECPDWRGEEWSAPRTYTFMKEIITSAVGN